MKKNKKEIFDSWITFSAGYYTQNINIFNEKLTIHLLSLQYEVKNFIFLLKYRQRKVDLSTSQKSLVFVTMRHRKFHLYTQLSYTKISYLRKNTYLRKDAETFSFEGNLKKYDISLKRKHTKTNENMIFSVVFTNFCKTKILFFVQ